MKHRTILVVDDEIDLLELYNLSLNALGLLIF